MAVYKELFFDSHDIYEYYFRIQSDGTVKYRTYYMFTRQKYFGRIAYISPTSTYSWESPKGKVMDACLDSIDTSVAQTLYVCPQSKISRDVLRNNGFKITYSREKADVTVLPTMEDNPPTFLCRFAFVKDGSLHIVEVDRAVNNQPDFTTEEFELTKEAILKKFSSIDESQLIYSADRKMSNLKIFFLKPCQEISEILTSPKSYYYPRTCVFDSNVQYSGSTSISPDTLLLWSKMKDKDLLEKAILNSNWKDYPVTLCIFLNKEGINPEYRFGNAGKVMLEAINYDLYRRGGSLGDQVVTAEDWNMLQSYLMLRFGVGEKGGYTEKTYPYDEFVRSKIAVIPTKIEAPMSFKNLMLQVDN